MNKSIVAMIVSGLFMGPSWADDVTDTLHSAIEAYEAGDLQYALEEMAFARQLIVALKSDALSAYLPEAPAGWTRHMEEDMSATMSMMGGGTGAGAAYIGPDSSQNISLSFMADNAMVSTMGAMIGNAAMFGSEIVRVNREKFVNDDGNLMGLIGNRILVQADGNNVDIETIIALLEMIDFDGLEDFFD